MKLKKLKKELLSSIEEVCRESDDIVLDPKKDFTRTRKLPLREVIRCTVAMGGNSLKHELLDILGYSPDIATSSAFVQQRTKLKPEALKRVMDSPQDLYLYLRRCSAGGGVAGRGTYRRRTRSLQYNNVLRLQ